MRRPGWWTTTSLARPARALPGVQALLGFQLLAVLSQTFDSLPLASKLVHAAALGCISLTVILLVAPAAFHRIAFNGADCERFYRIGSRLVTTALFPLAFGLAGTLAALRQRPLALLRNE